jgi:alanyl-tRNA synthetase
MNSQEIRSSFLSFFEERGHRVVPSSSLIPADDPTLFFNNAGMNQFKDVFTGQAKRDYVRAASSQKCMRVSGKHNDFETVGRSPRHHTFFEMLGNFSFGDYFKREAIADAWELLTVVWKIDPAQLVASVYEEDEEAAELWTEVAGLPPEKLYRLGKDENYWSMGPVGPNGPCSEIHVDFGGGCGLDACDPSCDCGRFLEVWNLVFMQYQTDADGVTSDLPKPSIDTGMGLERITSVLQGVDSTYETDLLLPVIEAIAGRSGLTYKPWKRGGEAEAAADEEQVAMRVVADHIRAITFLVADGVHPTNEGRGYVLRKILRRAAGHASRIGLKAPVLADLSAVVTQIMGADYPELERNAGRVRTTIEHEERAFEATLEQGTSLLVEVIDRVKSAEGDLIPGADAFRLHDTFGFPLEYTVELAERAGLQVDRAGYEAALEDQRTRARAAAKTTAATPELPAQLELPETEFTGYFELESEDCEVLALVKDGLAVERLASGEEGWAVLSRTPFYAESGGQVGDTGRLTGGGCDCIVADTQSLRPGVSGHRVRVESGALERGSTVRGAVDGDRRRRIMANHTATHLLHRALKDVLGEHVAQAGSLVEPDRLRFDFNHHAAVSREDLDEIERRVNERVFAHLPVQKATMGHQEALDAGAVAMFGEKYGDEVRVVSVDSWSVELCGGTHCLTTEQIGGLRIVSERGVAAGVRRIEGVTGRGLVERLVEDESILGEAEKLLKTPRGEVIGSLQRLAEQVKSLRKELEKAREEAATGGGGARREDVGGTAVELRRLSGLDIKALRDMADDARAKAGAGALLLAADKDGKAAIVLSLDGTLVERLGGEPARELVLAMAPELGGGGSGKAGLAWAGGKKVEGLDVALDLFPGLLAKQLEDRAS